MTAVSGRSILRGQSVRIQGLLKRHDDFGQSSDRLNAPEPDIHGLTPTQNSAGRQDRVPRLGRGDCRPSLQGFSGAAICAAVVIGECARSTL